MWEDAVKTPANTRPRRFCCTIRRQEWSAQQTIDKRVEWAKTSRGGQQYDMLRVFDDAPLCSSIYGLCE